MPENYSERIHIELYNVGKTPLELAEIFKMSERSIALREQRLRKKGKIKLRRNLPTSRTVSKPSVCTEEIEPLDWTIAKSTKEYDKNPPKFTSYLVLADTHVPYTNTKAVKPILQLMDDIKFDGLVLLGDIIENETISHWLENKHKTLENKRIQADYKEANKLLDELDKRLPVGCDKRYFWGNHECVDEKTELLTQRGWIKYTEINTDKDLVLSFNHNIKMGEWVKIDRLFVKKYTGKLNKLVTRKINLLATDNHKLYYKNKQDDKYNYRELKTLSKRNYIIPISCSLNNKKTIKISDEYISLAGWILTDGGITKKYGYIRIYQSKKQNILALRSLLKKLQIKYSEGIRQRDIKEICGRKLTKQSLPTNDFIISAEDSRKILKILNIKSKQDFPEWLSDLSDNQFRVFINSVIDGDGSRHKSSPKNSLMIYGEYKFLENLQILCLTHNYSASLSEYREGDWRLNLVPRNYHNLYLTTQMTKEEYDGEVWDLTVKNHNFMIRREGKCHFTGNCWYNDLIEKLPALEGLLNPTIEMKLKERGYKVYEEINHIERIGKLSFTHGIYATQNSVKKHIDELKTNVIFGHVHSPEMRFESSPAKEVALAGYSVGCLCDLSPSYMKNRPHRWSHGFAVISFLEGGYFDVNLVRIVKNRFIFNQKLYTGE